MTDDPKVYTRINGQNIDISEAQVPAERTYREAWINQGARITVDMPTARVIHRDNLRRERAPLLLALDVAYMRALEGSDTQTAIEISRSKQSLRDVTSDPRIEAATTPEELASLTLVNLTSL